MELELAKPEFYICGVDICKQGSQFCHRLQRRCVWCADVQADCFTQHQQQNCTLFCMNKWKDERQAFACECGNECDVWAAPTYIFLAISVILFVSLIGIILYNNKQTISSFIRRVLDFGAESRRSLCCSLCMNDSDRGRHTLLCHCAEGSQEIPHVHMERDQSDKSSLDAQGIPPVPQRNPTEDCVTSKTGFAHGGRKDEVRRELPLNHFIASGQRNGFDYNSNSLD